MEPSAMKTNLARTSLLLALGLVAGAPAPAQNAPAAAPAPRELTLVVVESLDRHADRPGEFDRIDIVFTKVFEKRKWPVKISAERFAANTPSHDIELRMFYQGIHPELPGDETFRAWMVLDDHGTKHDFGIIKFRYYPRPLETREDVLENTLRGAANAVANKIEPILFPKAGPPKP
jgi:hypothetical protein